MRKQGKAELVQAFKRLMHIFFQVANGDHLSWGKGLSHNGCDCHGLNLNCCYNNR